MVTSSDQKKINRIDQRRAAEKARADAERRREKERCEEEAIRAGQSPEATDETEPQGEASRPTSDGTAIMAPDLAAGTVTVNGVPLAQPATTGTIPPWEDDPPADGAGYTQKTMQELTSARTRALRSLLAADPCTGLTLAVYALGAQQIAREGPVGLSVHAFSCLLSSDAEPLASAREALGASVPDTESGWLGWCIAQNAETLLATLAILIASTLDLSHTGAFAAAARRGTIADMLATRLQLDMTGWWRPDEAFFTGLTKAKITDAILNSPAAQALETNADREAFTKQLAAKRKDELAAMAAQSLDGAGWLPEPLRTAGLVPAHGDPCFAVTDEGLQALAASEAVERDVAAAIAVAAE